MEICFIYWKKKRFIIMNNDCTNVTWKKNWKKPFFKLNYKEIKPQILKQDTFGKKNGWNFRNTIFFTVSNFNAEWQNCLISAFFYFQRNYENNIVNLYFILVPIPYNTHIQNHKLLFGTLHSLVADLSAKFFLPPYINCRNL